MDEKGLIQRAQEGDREAFCALSRQYRDALIRVAYGYLHDRDEALDAVQEALLKAYRKIKTFKKEASLYTWLYRITANHCKDRLRKHWHKSTVLFGDLKPDGEPMEWPDHDADPAQQAEDGERERLVRDAIGSLPDKHRDVLLLRELGEMSYKEIADALNCREGTVMSRLFHARKMLAEKLQPVIEDLL